MEGPAKMPAGYKNPDLPVKEDPPLSESKDPSGKVKDTSPDNNQGEWYEAKSEQGYTYYWNTVTGGTNI